ncbi:hypothetical protein NDU88_001103 [Pleurodeles waltl]|uniref:Uncharacterized protein n=1 Tax=Pleurodeles waltl TaxID=8319 RepID=A0AAV7VYG3_PLEWA|nr:hypothetical protein NDU88_001103 [Pleurodeles waltl]
MPPSPPPVIQSPKSKCRTRSSHPLVAPGPLSSGQARALWQALFSAESESTPAPPCYGTLTSSCPHPTTNWVSLAAGGPPLQAPSVSVSVLLFGPVAPPQATPLLEGPHTPCLGLYTVGHLRAAADRALAQLQWGGFQWAPPPYQVRRHPSLGAPVPSGTHGPGPPRPQEGPTTTASPPGPTSCSNSCCQAGPTFPTGRCEPRRAPGPGLSPCRCSLHAHGTGLAQASSADAEIFTPSPAAARPSGPAQRAGAPLSLFATVHGKITDRGRRHPKSQVRSHLASPASPVDHSTGPQGRPQAPASCGGAHPRLRREFRTSPVWATTLQH